jgi:hypothetical protein
MKTYEVQQYEVHVSTWHVKAESEADAIERVLDGDGDDVGFEYVETLDERHGENLPPSIRKVEEII